ncbi:MULTISPECIES: TM2 domain-containing protein [Catenuloplanes]|uniref:TM2 domain-containing membrane protein YozV n=1 Tax=Catenuloplanes niger TaxID=587534 RepID=A0AAE3ZWF4_9ACTN|nr:TM2 domain-containing protein [Catenuloplanes niger]MDR7327142.1 TM2 domain-containing membrane protein YozV [Catenuloplanes niger]
MKAGAGPALARPPAVPALHASVTAGRRSWIVTLLLCLLLGMFGAHRFYTGKIGTGVLMLLTLGGFGIWALLDLFLIALGWYADRDGAPLT